MNERRLKEVLELKKEHYRNNVLMLQTERQKRDHVE